MASRRTKKRRTRARARPVAARGDGVVLSAVRLGLGALSLGAVEVDRRMREASRHSHGVDGRPVAVPPGRIDAGSLAAGVAVESAEALTRAFAVVSEGTRRAGGSVNSLAGLPILSGALQPLRRRGESLRQAAARVCARGRAERLAGARMFEVLIEETTAGSVRGIAKSALKELTRSPEVHELVRSESTGLATSTILEVRANSERADDRLERRVRGWLGIARRNGGDARAAPHQAIGAGPGR